MVSGFLKELPGHATVLVRLLVADMSENNGPLRAEHVHYMLNAELQSHKRLDVGQLLCICVLVSALLHTSLMIGHIVWVKLLALYYHVRSTCTQPPQLQHAADVHLPEMRLHVNHVKTRRAVVCQCGMFTAHSNTEHISLHSDAAFIHQDRSSLVPFF